jgi:hypothetical protein
MPQMPLPRPAHQMGGRMPQPPQGFPRPETNGLDRSGAGPNSQNQHVVIDLNR